MTHRTTLRRTFVPAILILSVMLTLLPPDEASSNALPMDTLARIHASDGAAGDSLGDAVALDGDQMAVSASAADVNGVNGAGAVYLYQRDTAAPVGWTEIKKLAVALPEVNELYGASVALDGDVLAVGATARNVGTNSDVGVVYLYERNQGGPNNWGLRTTISEPLGGFSSFGSGVALDGNLLLVGAKGAFQLRGAAYLYERSADWTKVKELRDLTGVIADYFGEDVAIDGDTIVIGQPMHSFSTRDDKGGAAFVFGRNQGGPNNWGVVRRLTADASEPDSGFGSAVVLDGDTVVLGAPEAGSGGPSPVLRTGAAFVFERDQGGVNSWGMVKRLIAEDGATGQRYGDALALAGDELLVGAALSNAGGFTSQGIVHRYRRDQGGPGTWGAMPTLEAEDGLVGDRFGSAIAVQGATTVVGAPGHFDGRGAVYVPAEDEPPPPPLTRIYLPMVSTIGFIPTGVLRDGGMVEATSGARIGAVVGTFSEEVGVLIEPAPPPAVSIGDNVSVVGAYHAVGAARRIATPTDKPLLIGLPVPDGANPDDMAIAVLLPESGSTESAGSGSRWTSLPGHYDADSDLFVATIAALPLDIVSVVLIEHPSLDQLPAAVSNDTVRGPMVAPAQSPIQFMVKCEVMSFTDCSNANLALLKSELDLAYADFVGNHNFREPRLVRAIGFFRGTNAQPDLTPTTAFHGIMLESPPCEDAGTSFGGLYRFDTASLHVCMEPGSTPAEIKSIVRHELFHAIQASYARIFQDMVGSDRPKADWTIEGTASAAERSSSSMRISLDFQAHTISDSLVEDTDLYEYSAQDFWVYTGQELGVNLSYLRSVFEAGGTPERVATALNLSDAYWKWAKNQAFEKEQRVHPDMQEASCIIEPTLTGTHTVGNWPGTVRAPGTLPPLTSAVVEINFTQTMEIGNLSAPSSGGDDIVRYKAYFAVANPDCASDPEGERTLGVLRNNKMYVLVSNTSPTDTHTYTVIVQGSR